MCELIDRDVRVQPAGKARDDCGCRIAWSDFRPALLRFLHLPDQHSAMRLAVKPVVMADRIADVQLKLVATYLRHMCPKYRGHRGLKCMHNACINFSGRVNLPVPTP